MGKNTQLSLDFKMVSGKKVTADFTGGNVTSDAGVLALREVADNIGIVDKLADAITDKRHQSYIQHGLKDLLSQRILQIACGYEDADDADKLRTDPGFKISCDRLPSESDLASQPTLSRLENALSKQDVYRMTEVLCDQFTASFKNPPESIILDADDTHSTTYGAQQMCLFNSHYDNYGFQPFYIFEGVTGKLITSILRPGKRPSGKEILAIIKRVILRIRKAWPQVLILVRGDSHFASPDLFKWLEKKPNVYYIVGISTNSRLKDMAQSTAALAHERYKLFEKKARVFGEINYKAKSWKKKRRVIIMAEYSRKGENLRYITTNLAKKRPAFLYEAVYSDRGRMENFIKEHKNALKSSRTSCHNFIANCVRLMLHSAAYVILHKLRETGLAGTDYANAQFDTIQLLLLKIGAEVSEMKTKVHFKLPSSYPLQEVFWEMYHSIIMQT